MTQSNFNLPNTDGATFRSNNNTAHQAHATWSSGSTAPSTTYPYQVWIDTANGLLKRRNASNTAWITEAKIDGSNPSRYDASQNDYTPDFPGAATVNLRDYLDRLSVPIERYGGGTGKTGAENVAAFNDAVAFVQSVSALGGGFVDFSYGDYTINDALVLPDGIVIRGKGHLSTRLVKENQPDPHWMVESEDFASLTGSNLWNDSDGVPSAVGLMDIAVWGKGNPPASATDRGGVRLYARRVMVRNLLIHNTDGDGFYSECADAGGQTTFKDMPEGDIGPIWVYRAGDDNFVFRGPHDQYISQVGSSGAGRDGAVFDRSSGTYKGTSDVGFIHSYGHGRHGVRCDTPMHIAHCIGESNQGVGILLSDAPNSWIGWAQAYNNTADGNPNYEVDIFDTAVNTVISSCQITGSGVTGSLRNRANHVVVNGIGLNGGGNGVEAIRNEGDYCTFQGTIDGFTGTGGVGLIVDGGFGCGYDLSINGPPTVVDTASGDYTHSHFRIRGSSPSGATVWANPPTLAQRKNMTIDVNYKVGTTAIKSREYADDNAATVDNSTTGTYTWTYNHNLPFAPDVSEVRAGVSFTGANYNWDALGPFVNSVSSTQIEIDYVIKGTVASGGTQPQLQLDVRLGG